MLSEKIELLGKDLYTDIPGTLTLKAIPTVCELDYVSSEDFEQTMLDKIFPKAIEEKINFRNLLEIDFHWICRCLRFLNYGPMYTTNAIYCPTCGRVAGDAQVDLRSVECIPLPQGFVNDIVIKKDEFIDFKGDIHLKLPTIQDMINCQKDNVFYDGSGNGSREYARMCYMIKAVGNEKELSPIDAKNAIEKHLSRADFLILEDRVKELVNYGLRAAGKVTCPRCHNANSLYIALVDDKFFRPSVGDLKAGRNDRGTWPMEDASRS